MTDQRSSARDTVEAPASALAIEANFDDLTKAAFKYRQKHVYPYLESQGIKVVLLRGKQAVRRRVAVAAVQAEIQYLIGVGHGKADSFRGYRNKTVFRLGRYQAEEVRGKVIHLLSCFTASNLGEDFRAHGCLAFFGYKEEFAVPFDDLEELDDLAEEFFGSDAEIDRAFADGVAVEQIQRRVIGKFNEHIAQLDQRGQRESSAVLESNRDLLIALFNES